MPSDEGEDEGVFGGVLVHLVVFVVVNLLLIAAWVLFSTGTLSQVPGYLRSLEASRDAGFWPEYVIVFWGAGLLIHAGVVLVTTPGRLRRRRARRQQRRRLHAGVVGMVDGTPLEGAALAGIRALDGDKAAKTAKRDAAKKRKKGGSKAAAGGPARAKAKAKGNGKRKGKATTPGGAEQSDPARAAASPSGAPSDGDGRRPGTKTPVERRADDVGTPRFGRHASDRQPGRHWVAVLFTDIVASTPLNRSLGDDGWAQLLGEHRRTVRRCLAEHRGVEVGTQGDGFLVRFDAPDDAAACAVALQLACAEDRARLGHPLRIRIGIHAGEVVQNDDDLVGRVINLASRVTDAADADEILVTEPLADHLTTEVLLVDRGLRTLKGFDQPRHLLALLWRVPESDEALDLDRDPGGEPVDGGRRPG